MAKWLGIRYIEGENYIISLPTESQWEYACRAGTTTTYHFAEGIDDSNWDSNWNFDGMIGHTTARGKYPENDWELYDMHGNVWEWCLDWYSKHYYQASREIDPRGPQVCLAAGCAAVAGTASAGSAVRRTATGRKPGCRDLQPRVPPGRSSWWSQVGQSCRQGVAQSEA